MIETTSNPTLWWFFSADSFVAVVAIVDGRVMPLVCPPFLLVQHLERYNRQIDVVEDTQRSF